MEGEPDPNIIDTAPADPNQIEPEKKSKRPRRKPPEPGEVQITAAGKAKAQEVRDTLIELVEKLAVAESKRRRGSMIDASDYETAFGLIAGPPKREKAVAIVADVAYVIGSCLIGYAINIYTGSASVKSDGHIAMIGGIGLLAIGTVIKYIMPRK